MTMDIRMRRAKKTDLPTIWKATLQTVWDDTARGALATSMVTLLGIRHALAADAERGAP